MKSPNSKNSSSNESSPAKSYVFVNVIIFVSENWNAFSMRCWSAPSPRLRRSSSMHRTPVYNPISTALSSFCIWGRASMLSPETISL